MLIDLTNTTTEVFESNLKARTQYIFNKGGSRSSKTYSLMQLAYLIALMNDNKTISVCSESMPHLKRGAMKDFFDFLKNNNLYIRKNHNISSSSYQVGKSIIEFFGVESASKVHGASRDYLFVNEIQNISYETFFQLAMRTSKRVFADYNPVRRFWVDTEYLENPNFVNKSTLIKSTLFNNKFCPQNIKDTILSRALTDANYKRVYVDGETGSVEGLVYPDFEVVCNVIPDNYKLLGIGLDWGFSNDPCAITAIYQYQNNIRLKQLCYSTGLVNSKVIAILNSFGCGIQGHDNQYIEVIADNAEPKSITDLCNAGINCKPIKDKSIVYGIKKVKEFLIQVTEDSYGIKEELNNYSWDTDKDNNYIEYPKDKYNHALDGIRYFIVHKFGQSQSKTFGIML